MHFELTASLRRFAIHSALMIGLAAPAYAQKLFDQTDLGSSVVANKASHNGFVGLYMAAGGYSQNVLSFNNGGNGFPQVTGGTPMGPNICKYSSICP